MTPRAPEFLPPPPQQRPELDRDASQHSKASAPSLSPSNEADDEQSLSDDYLEMASDRSPPHYDGEDVRLTSDKELSGFYMYGWAAEVFVVCGIGSFIPVTLEQLARENQVARRGHWQELGQPFQYAEQDDREQARVHGDATRASWSA